MSTPAGRLLDQWGRSAEKLRISVTDRCNFRCTYCMPEEGLKWMQREAILTYEEISRLARIFVELGIRQIRLTGGEPLLRKDLPVLVKQLKALPLLENLSITTNGVLLKKQAPALYEAGLKSYNVSLDSLDPLRFSQAVRRDALDQVFEGLHSLSQFPDVTVKINVVVIRNFNGHEALDFARLAREHDWEVRFIEFMPLGTDDHWQQEMVVSGESLRQQIAEVYPLQLRSKAGKHPAERWRFSDTERGGLGFINSVSAPFCKTCNRIRLTADGQIRTCLFSLKENDLKALLRNGSSDELIAEHIQKIVWHKEAGHGINQADFQRPDRSMSSIGG